jgi:hypothetical protein
VKEQFLRQVKHRLKFIAIVIIGVIMLLYIVYSSFLIMSTNGIHFTFFVIIICIYAVQIIALVASTVFYSYVMRKMWGDTFDYPIRRVKQISIALTIGYILSIIALTSLVIKTYNRDVQ